MHFFLLVEASAAIVRRFTAAYMRLSSVCGIGFLFFFTSLMAFNIKWRQKREQNACNLSPLKHNIDTETFPFSILLFFPPLHLFHSFLYFNDVHPSSSMSSDIHNWNESNKRKWPQEICVYTLYTSLSRSKNVDFSIS